jgi:phosphinothricin acetyltransferase
MMTPLAVSVIQSMSNSQKGLLIDKMREEDWESVRSIYREGIETGNATFETRVPDWEEWDNNHLQSCRLVARKEGQVVGWAALSPVSERCVYRGTAEVSVYMSPDFHGQGIGKALLQRLVEESEQHGLWTLQAGIFPENIVSIELHKACGFREVGRREKIGQMNGIWRDVVIFERRSRIVGV